MNFDEFKSFLDELGLGPKDFYTETSREQLKKVKKKFGHWKNVNNEMTYKNEDYEALFVIHFKDHDFYVGFNYYYDSWDSHDFDDAIWAEYEPKPITVIKYERKQI